MDLDGIGVLHICWANLDLVAEESRMGYLKDANSLVLKVERKSYFRIPEECKIEAPREQTEAESRIEAHSVTLERSHVRNKKTGNVCNHTVSKRIYISSVDVFQNQNIFIFSRTLQILITVA